MINGEFRQYKGTRDKDSFITFIEEKKWNNVEPVPQWKSPNSIQMGVVSSFFKLSQMLRVSNYVLLFKLAIVVYWHIFISLLFIVEGMYLFVFFFQQIHTDLMENFGLPTWGSYLIFAVATIILGAILGLILVCIIDFIYPPNSHSKKQQNDKLGNKKTDKNSDDELVRNLQ